MLPAQPDALGTLVTKPLDVSTGLVRLGNYTAFRKEIGVTNDRVERPRTDVILVPEGTASLTVRWIGDGFEYFSPGVACTMEFLDLELEGPSSQVYLPQQDAALVHSVTVVDPEPGLWNVMIDTQAEFACTGAASDAYPGDPPWGPYDPRIATVAAIRHAGFDTHVELSSSNIARNEATTIRAYAQLFGEPITGLVATAMIVPRTGGLVTEVLLHDDATHGDDVASDGIYAGRFGGGPGDLLAAGDRIVKVRFDTIEGVSVTVPTVDAVLAGTTDPGPGRAVQTAELWDEDGLTVLDCAGSLCGLEVAVASTNPTDGACDFVLEPGQSYPNLVVETRGLPLVPNSTSVWLSGIGVHITNVSILDYDPSTTIGHVQFSAELAASAQSGARKVYVQSAGRQVSSASCGEIDVGRIPQGCLEAPSPETCCPSGHVLVEGTAGPDSIQIQSFAAEPSCVFGFGSDDVIESFSPHDDFVHGNDGGDEITVYAGDNDLVGGAGEDLLTCGGYNDEAHGQAGDDDILGGAGSDRLDGGDGHDLLNGEGGNDVLIGGRGNDILLGGDGADLLLPGSGVDSVSGGSGADVVRIRAVCEFSPRKYLSGGDGRYQDTLILPTTLAAAQAANMVIEGFEIIVENDTSEVALAVCP